ncbi:hypothetical protein Hanom_Chr03g00206691 [Helianthus anomalus]
MVYNRVAWLNIQGIPIDLRDNTILNTIIGRFGMVVYESSISIKVANLASTQVGVLVEQGLRINEEVKLAFEGRDGIMLDCGRYW